jgi:hypothetical protein
MIIMDTVAGMITIQDIHHIAIGAIINAEGSVKRTKMNLGKPESVAVTFTVFRG